MNLKCNQCNKKIELSDRFCPYCGSHNETGEIKMICPNCKHKNPENTSFCKKCGFSLVENAAADTKKKTAKTYASSGNYSGKMIQGKTSRGWKIFRNLLLIIVLLAIISLVIWFQADPDAGKKLTDVLMGIAFMAVFFLVGWLFMRGKKGKRRHSNDDYNWDHNNDNDFDGDDDD